MNVEFLVWDEEDGGPEAGQAYHAGTPDGAAEKYASDDHVGLAEGYYNSGHRISVRAPDGSITTWEVTVEWEPTFYSTPVDD